MARGIVNCGIIILMLVVAALADVPTAMNYQGRLTDAAGDPVVNGNYSVTFTIYDAISGGISHWTETQVLKVTDGLFSTQLGQINPILDSVFNGTTRYMGIFVEGGPEISPRLPLISVSFAFQASKADSSIASETAQYADDANHAVFAGFADSAGASSTSGYADSTGAITDGAVDFADIGQNGATSGQVMKWSQSGWAAAADNTGSGSGGWTDDGSVVRLDAASDSVGIGTSTPSEKLDVEGNILIQGKATIGSGHTNSGAYAFVAGDNNTASGKGSTVSGGTSNVASGATSSIGGGAGNTASSPRATVGGGNNNSASGSYATVAGGAVNSAVGDSSFVGGGSRNAAVGVNSTVSGGFADSASNDYTTVGGGRFNTTSAYSATVSGGSANSASANYATVGGGNGNAASNASSTIGGGNNNAVTGVFSTVGGGSGNHAVGSYSTVGGGNDNAANGHYSGILSGLSNTASGAYSTVGGGYDNIASGDSSVVAGGKLNLASGIFATVSGGRKDTASGEYATSGGGTHNNASGNQSTIAGGYVNRASGEKSSIGGGWTNMAMDTTSTVAGGYMNIASGVKSFVGGGSTNEASGMRSTVAGGGSSDATGEASTVGGGWLNQCGGDFSTIPGGYENTTGGHYSFAAGRRAKANHNGAFVWGDSDNSDVSSSADNQFTARTTGGARFFTNWTLTTGVTLAPGGGAWAAVSDSAVKENIRPIDGDEILEKLSQLDVTRWNYESQDASIEHIGPMAQDFYRLFGVGDNNTTITTIDPDGISLAAIKELIEKNKKLEHEVAELKQLMQDFIQSKE